MYRQKPQAIGDIVNKVVRDGGLELPLLQKRVIDAWEMVVGELLAAQGYTAARGAADADYLPTAKYIKNQTLFVSLPHPALRAELMMLRTPLVARLNARVGAYVITDIRVY